MSCLLRQQLNEGQMIYWPPLQGKRRMASPPVGSETDVTIYADEIYQPESVAFP